MSILNKRAVALPKIIRPTKPSQSPRTPKPTTPPDQSPLPDGALTDIAGGATGFFDEADALFGKVADLRAPHDRTVRKN